MKKSIYRILLIIVGLLHALAFFFIPFAKLEGIAGGLGDLAGMLGAGEAYPKKLTGMALLKSSSIIGISDEEAGILLVLVLLPVVLGALCTCLQFFGRGKASYLTALLCSLLFFGCYGFQYLIYQELEQAFYTISIAGFALVFLASGVQFLVSIVGMVKDGKTVAEKSKPKRR